jgi:hypothetical protein
MTDVASLPIHPLHLRKERDMQHAEQRLQQVQAQQAELRAQREAERQVLAARAERPERRTVRRHVGQRLIRLGERVAGDVVTSPAWQG